MAFFLLSSLRKGLKIFQRNHGKVIIPGGDDVACDDPVAPIEEDSGSWTRCLFFFAQQKRIDSSNANCLQLQRDAGIEAAQLGKESNAIGRMDVEEMGVRSICTPELSNSPVSSMTESEVCAEDKDKEPSSLHQEGRKLQQFQEEIVVLHDVPSAQPPTTRFLPEMTSGYETFSSSSSCNDGPRTTNEKSGASLQLDERNGLDSPKNAHYRSSSPVGMQSEVQDESRTPLGVGRLLSDDEDVFLNDSDDGDNGCIQKGKQEALKTQEIQIEESGGDGGYTSMVPQNLTTDGYESFSSYSCDAEPEQQSQLNSTGSKLEDHYNIAENREEATVVCDSNGDESESMHDIDVYNWITTDKESIQCTGSWYKDLEESPKLEEERFSSAVSPLPQQLLSPESSKLGFVSTSPVSRSHCRPRPSLLRFPTSDSRSASPPLSPQPAVPCVKETCDVSRKMASLPQQEQLSHAQVILISAIQN